MLKQLKQIAAEYDPENPCPIDAKYMHKYLCALIEKEMAMIDLGLNEQGHALAARTINKGDSYGLNDCLTYDEDKGPLIEFYHAATDTAPAYFVSRYYRSTLMGEYDLIPDRTPAALHGVCLCGSSGLTATAEQVQQACNAQGHELRYLAFKQLQKE